MKKVIKNCTRQSRLARINALALPKKRPDVVALLHRTLPAPVSKAALYGKVPSRIFILSKPKNRLPNLEHIPRPIITLARSSIDKKKSGSEYNASKRILELSKPKPLYRNVHRKCLNSEQQEAIYLRPSATRNSNAANDRKDWLKKNAAPKRVFRPPVEPKKYSKMPKSLLKELIDRLSTVPEFKQRIKKSNIPKKPERKIGRLSETMLQSVQRLSEPRKIASEMRLNIEFNPYNIPLRVLKHVASKRTTELATPKIYVKTGVLVGFKEDAFEVSKAALNYKASKRIIRLAIPRQR